MRHLSSCKVCRERRKKCIRSQQGTSCDYCIRRGLQCSSPAGGDSSSTGKEYASLGMREMDKRTLKSTALQPEPEFALDLVKLFFLYYHVSFPNLFHPPSFEASVVDGSVPRILFFGIAGISARYSLHPSWNRIHPWHRGEPYTEEAARLLDLNDISLTSIQACVLLGIAAAMRGEPASESVYLSVAFRMALILDLPNAPSGSAIEAEINNRVWWSLFTSDTWNSAIMCIPRTIKWRDDVRFPMDEWTFLHDYNGLCGQASPSAVSHQTGEASEILAGPEEFTALGHKVKLNLILHKIIELNMSVVAETIPAEHINDAVLRLQASLDEWFDGLPDAWRYTEENLQKWAAANMGRLFMSLYIDFNHACQLLFFRFLYLSQERGLCGDDQGTYELACQLAQRCRGHAANLCQLLQDANKRPETEMLYALLGHILSIASAVQIHNLLFSADESEITASRVGLEDNFAFLSRLYQYWPNVSASFSRLEAFHEVCLQSKDSSFRLDLWMLKFILEFSRPVRGKDSSSASEEGKNSWSLERLKITLKVGD